MGSANQALSTTSIGSSPANDERFSPATNEAVMNVISLAEARRKFSQSSMTSQGFLALCRDMLGKLGIQLGSSQVAYAAELIRFRAMVAANDSSCQGSKIDGSTQQITSGGIKPANDASYKQNEAA